MYVCAMFIKQFKKSDILQILCLIGGSCDQSLILLSDSYWFQKYSDVIVLLLFCKTVKKWSVEKYFQTETSSLYELYHSKRGNIMSLSMCKTFDCMRKGTFWHTYYSRRWWQDFRHNWFSKNSNTLKLRSRSTWKQLRHLWDFCHSCLLGECQ